jgi:hypothetical protein
VDFDTAQGIGDIGEKLEVQWDSKSVVYRLQGSL